MTAAVNDANFAQDVLAAPEPVVVDFWAEWCGPCKMIAPHLEELSKEFGGKVKIVKLNVDENQETASEFQVFSIPTMILFKCGKPEARIVGYMPKPALLKKLSAHVSFEAAEAQQPTLS